MKKLIYFLALSMFSLSFLISCGEEDEPTTTTDETIDDNGNAGDTNNSENTATISDSLQGTWYSVSAQIQGTNSTSAAIHNLTSNEMAVLSYDTISFSNSTVTHTWDPIGNNASWPDKIISGTFTVSDNILTNSITWKKDWTETGFGYIPEIDTTFTETQTYNISFAHNTTNNTDTLVVKMIGSTQITNNHYEEVMSLGLSNTTVADNPNLTIKFIKK